MIVVVRAMGSQFRGDCQGSTTEKYLGWSQNPDGGMREPHAKYKSFGGDTRDQRATSSGDACRSLSACGEVASAHLIAADARRLAPVARRQQTLSKPTCGAA